MFGESPAGDADRVERGVVGDDMMNMTCIRQIDEFKLPWWIQREIG